MSTAADGNVAGMEGAGRDVVREATGDELAAVYDVVVIGGGAAGLSGAVALGRARRSVLVVDAGEPRNALAGHVHNFLSRDGTTPADLLAAGRAEVARYGGRFVRGTVTDARPVTGKPGDRGLARFEVDLADGRSVPARRLLVATGLVDELPPIPGVTERWGRDVLHCPYCHGWEVRDQAIGILGSNPMAVHGALLWRQWSEDVVLFQHTAPALSAEKVEELTARGVTVIDGEVAGLEIVDDRLTGVRLRSGEVVPRQALVVAPRFTARAGILTGLGLATTDLEMAGHVFGSSVPADPRGATSVPGVWVAGNVTDLVGQVMTVASAGLWAGAHINAELVTEDTARAVEGFRARSEVSDDPFSAGMESAMSDLVLGERRHGL